MATFHVGQSTSNLQRGGACSNCRRRKVKCDGVRSGCNQCRLRPPRSGTPCVFDLDAGPAHHTAVQLQDTIKLLKARITQLEQASGHSGPQVLLQEPYRSPTPQAAGLSRSASRSSLTPESVLEFLVLQEPPPEIISKLINTFLDKFANTGYFFLEPLRFFNSALLPLPLGHFDRPAQSLLNVVYLWGTVFSTSIPDPSTEQTFLHNALQSLPGDIQRFPSHPRLVLETLQAEVMLSLYYVHVALPAPGRYHSAAAMSLALSAGLHQRSPQSHPVPYFPLVDPLLPPALNATEEAERINAFWAVVIVDNCWVAAEGHPSTTPYGSVIDTPWQSGSDGVGGATITKFLKGDDQHGHATVTLFTKASILLERIVAFSVRSNTIDAAALDSLDQRLYTFHSSLPHGPGGKALLMAHALADLAIVRLHSPFSHSSDTSRYKYLSAANRIVSSMQTVEPTAASHQTYPILGPLCATVCTVYIGELASLRMRGDTQARIQYQEIDARVASLLDTMASLAPTSPIIQRCLLSTRQAYGALGQEVRREWRDNV
ncbi:Zn(2)-Cys(6) binuclear cluster domain-containing protein [Mycena maculata]|uniref:Zn(2)-Cys(6) binuclear cluster domain-containing protein n=1 Tax=Mycena maculata TaxID=230809 RepID=A0AAD7NIP0_9AGAR|nr:Zn(2)-Cys(6) binuclear cluster domain-containing protein [Mycena maculata]